MSIVPQASATLIWAFSTQHEEVRCFVWEHSPVGWIIAVMFGNETLAIETAPTRWAMEAGVDMVWRGLLASGLGKTDAVSAEGPTPISYVPRSRRIEASLFAHTPFRHPEPSFDVASSDPPPRRRPH